MSNLYTLSMSLDRDQIDDQDSEQNPTYTGVIANKNLTSYYTHLSSKVLKDFAKKAREGVMVLANHNRGQVVGRSMSGTYVNNEEVRSKFYIERDLNLTGNAFGNGGYANTDDYIKAINTGTYRDLSVGFNDYTEVCDYCGESIEGSWFSVSCKNGHYPGQKIYVDKNGVEYDEPGRGRKEVIITAEITSGNLFEYSLVDLGAVPGAEIVKQAQQLGLNPNQKQYIMSRYGLNIDDPGADLDKYFKLGRPVELKIENKSFSFPERKGDSTMSDQITKVDKETIDTLTAELAKVTDKNKELQATVDKYESENLKKSLADAQEEVNTLREENKTLTDQVSELADMQKEYNSAVDQAKEEAKGEFIRKSGQNPDMKEFNDTMEGIKSLNVIKSLAHRWKVQGDARLGTTGRSTVSSYTEKVETGIDPSIYDPKDYI